MSANRILFKLRTVGRSMSTRGPSRSSRVDTPFQSHLESATMRHRQSRARRKDAKNQELRTQREPKVPRNERSVTRETPMKAVDHVGPKRIEELGRARKTVTSHSTPSATDMYRANKAGVKSSSGLAQATSSATTITTTVVSRPSSSMIPYLTIFGIVTMAGAGIAANSSTLQQQFPILQELFDQEYVRTLLGHVAPITPEESDDATKKGWFSSIWGSKGK